jgi:hypothetical protein
MPDALDLDPDLVAAFSDHEERLGIIALVNDGLALDAAERAIAAADRLCAFELWHDRLEQWKGSAGSLPPKVETAAVQAFGRAETSARELAGSAIDAVRAFVEAGFFDEAIPYTCEAIHKAGGTVDMAEVVEASKEVIPDLLAERGMAREHVDLLYRAIAEGSDGWVGLTLSSCEDGALMVRHGRRHNSLQAHAIHPLPLLDGSIWVHAGAIHMLARDEEAVVDNTPRTSPWGGILALAQALTEGYQGRRALTAAKGVQVYETGFLWVIIVIIVIIVLVVAGIVITVLCAAGKIKNKDVCTLGALLLIAGLFLGCVAAGGKLGAGDGGGVGCTVTWSSDGSDG